MCETVGTIDLFIVASPDIACPHELSACVFVFVKARCLWLVSFFSNF